MTTVDDRYIVVTTHIDRAEQDESGFVAFCPELGISSQGESLEETLQNVHEAVEEFVDTLAETGDLQTFLRQRDIPVYENVPQSPVHATVRANTGEIVAAFVARLRHGAPVA